MAQLPYQKYAALRFGSPVQRCAYWIAWLIFLVPCALVFRLRPGASRKVPAEGPYLLLANHTSFFDPLWIAYWVGRRCSFMGSELIFSKPVLKWLAPLGGCFPKAFAVKDPEAMATMNARYEAGSPVVIFPEGKRSYDGRALPVLPGIGRAVKRMNANVVVARIETGHLFHPRWAKLPRWVPVRVSHETLPAFGPDASAEDITTAIAEKMRIDADAPAPVGSFGVGMALGLPQYLWACPSCFRLEGLEASGWLRNEVRCRGCGECWRLDTSNRMHGKETLRVHEAHDRVLAHYSKAPVADEGAFAKCGVVLARPAARVLSLSRDHAPRTLAVGALSLSPRGLQLRSETGVEWSLAFNDVTRVSTAFGNTLTLRVGEQLVGLDLHGGNDLLWAHFTKAWFDQAKSALAATQAA